MRTSTGRRCAWPTAAHSPRAWTPTRHCADSTPSTASHPEEIIAALRQEKVLPVATDLITQFNPAVPDHDAAIRALELIATEVAPALGWKPATQPAPAGV